MHQVTIPTAEVRLSARIDGDGPTVLLLHGFPGTSYSWRHQLPVLAAAGYRAVAVDSRGYGGSERPAARAYPSTTIERDLIGVLDHLGVDRAHLVGQDFGSMYAWNLAQRHPDRVRSVLGTVPFAGTPTAFPPTEGFAKVAARHFLHLDYFQHVGRAEEDLGGDRLGEFLRRLLWALSAQGDLLSVFGHPASASYLDALPPSPDLPWSWLDVEELDTFVRAYAAGGPGRELAGGLASYRAADLDWESARAWDGTPVAHPSLIVMGEHDPVRTFTPPDLEQQRTWLTDLRDVVLVPGAGHHVQQEQPAAFSAVLLDWLRQVG